MANFRDDSFHMSEEELKHLEDEMNHASVKPGERGLASELPSPLYRIRTIHSNETFFAWFGEEPAAGGAVPGNAVPGEKIEGEEAGAPPTVAVSGEPAAAAPSEEEAGDLSCGALTGPEAEDSAENRHTETGLGSIPEAEILHGQRVQAMAAGQAAEPDADRTPTMRHFLETGILPTGGMVVAPTRYGRDLCEVQGIIRDLGVVNADEVVEIDRIATAEDLRRHEANLVKEATAFELCRQKISSRNLAMKLVSAHYLLEEPKVLFYFSAESRVDFRELVKDLVSNFKMRIELRQIGVRDEARVTGGCGVCGRVLCCHGVSDKLTPVSIKMAKDQNLSLNSLKISGPCGRLLCCLAYEYNFYRDARRELPNEGARFTYEGVLFRVIEVNALASTVKMAGEDGRILDMPAARFKYSEGRWQVREQA